jgi:hypothetical protein
MTGRGGRGGVPQGVGIAFHEPDGRHCHIDIANDPVDGFKVHINRYDGEPISLCLTPMEAMAVMRGLFNVLGRPVESNPDEDLPEPIDVRDYLAAMGTPPRDGAEAGE